MHSNPTDAGSPSLEHHAYSLDVSGYTLLPNQFDAAEIAALRECAEEALNASFKLGKPTGSYHGVRCVYAWGEPCVKLLENDIIHGLASLMIGDFQLWDMAVLTALPWPEEVKNKAIGWHRDFAGPHWGTEVLSYLWFFICLDDLTPENGATWVVPGSHRVYSKHARPVDEVWAENPLEQYPSRYQLCARAGDMLALNPTMIHSPGHNSTDKLRRILFVGTCHKSLQPLVDHWMIAGPAIQEHASERVRRMIRELKPLATTYNILPEGWRTGNSETAETQE